MCDTTAWGHRARGIPVVVNLAGGYIKDVTPRLHVQTPRAAVGAAADRHRVS